MSAYAHRERRCNCSHDESSHAFDETGFMGWQKC